MTRTAELFCCRLTAFCLAIGLMLITALIAGGAEARDLCNNFNNAPVINPPIRQTYCGLWQPPQVSQPVTYRVSQLVTYHYNRGYGAVPGTISLRASNGWTYTFPAHDDFGRTGVPSFNWIADVNADLPADFYAVIDSDWNTWSQNYLTRGWGFAIVRGEMNPVAASPPSSSGSPGLGPFCVSNAGAIADIAPCTGLVRPSGVPVTLTLRRNIPALLDTVQFYIPGVSSQVITGFIGVGGVGAGGIYTFVAPALLCINTGRAYNVRVYSGGTSYGDVGQFFPDCR